MQYSPRTNQTHSYHTTVLESFRTIINSGGQCDAPLLVLEFSLPPNLSLSLGGSEFDRPTNDHAEEGKEEELSLLDLKESSNAATLCLC